jgi:hypothetical protein
MSCDETGRRGHEHIEVLSVPYRMRAALGLVSPANYEQSLTSPRPLFRGGMIRQALCVSLTPQASRTSIRSIDDIVK